MKAYDLFDKVPDYVLFQVWVKKIYFCNVDSLKDYLIDEAVEEFNINYNFFKMFFNKE